MWNQCVRSLYCSPNLRSRLIKFRYGGRADQTGQVTTQTKTNVTHIAPEEAIWDFQIPQKWKRKRLDEDEIAVINNGGPL